MNEFPPPSEVPSATPPAPAAPTGSPLRRYARAISSPWVSIVLLVIVFLHQAIGSAFYPVRQAFEVNEMEWFNGTASAVLWLAICVCLVTASIVRVPWTLRKLGTHLTHAGVVALVLTCWIYFGFKHEGDALLVRRYVHVQSDAGACRLLPNPGYSAPLGTGPLAGTATVQSIMPRWTILSPEGKSEQAWAIMVQVELPDAPAFTATLIENRPDLTQYTLSGRRPDSFLSDYPRVQVEDGKLVAFTTDGKAVLATEVKKNAKTSEPIAGGERSLEITGVTADFPLLAEGFQGQNGTMIEWTLKTPAGQQSGSSIVGQPTLTRFQRARVKTAPDARLKTIALEPAPWTLAYHKDRAALWVRRENAALVSDPLKPMRAMDAEAVAMLPIRGLPRYHEHGEALGKKPLDLRIGAIDDVQFKVTGFAPYARLRTQWTDEEAQRSRLVFVTSPAIAQSAKVVLLMVSAPGSGLRQYPIELGGKAEFNLLGEGLTIKFNDILQKAGDAKDQQAADQPLDPRLDLELLSSSDGRSFKRQLRPSVASAIEDLPMLWVHCADQAALDALRANLAARFPDPTKTPPQIVPAEQRTSRMSVGDYESLIQVTATSNSGTTSIWVPYTPFPNLPRSLGNDGSLGMYAPRPVWIDVPGAGRFELSYGKEPLPMPGPIWMTGFEVPRRPGSNSPSEFFCHVGYDDLAAPKTAIIHMNHPLAWQDTFFFQASWDPQSQALTVLGVGNRPAGDAMLWASILLALGMAISGAMAALPGRKS